MRVSIMECQFTMKQQYIFNLYLYKVYILSAPVFILFSYIFTLIYL